MDWYSVVKFVHIVAAIGWLGGGMTMLISGVLARRDPDRMAVLRFMRTMNALALPLFVPASMTVLISGLTMAVLWVGFSAAWLVLALAGIAVSLGMGMGFIKPVGERIEARVAKEGLSEAIVGDVDRLTRIGRFDYAIMIAIVALMVFKPSWQDTSLLFGLAIALAFAAALFLIPRGGAAAPASAKA